MLPDGGMAGVWDGGGGVCCSFGGVGGGGVWVGGVGVAVVVAEVMMREVRGLCVWIARCEHAASSCVCTHHTPHIPTHTYPGLKMSTPLLSSDRIRSSCTMLACTSLLSCV